MVTEQSPTLFDTLVAYFVLGPEGNDSGWEKLAYWLLQAEHWMVQQAAVGLCEKGRFCSLIKVVYFWAEEE